MATLRDLTIEELLTSARSELDGLVELAERLNAASGSPKEQTDSALYIGAYHGSIGARIAVAEIKLREQGN